MVRDAEHTFDAQRIADTDLDMRLTVKSGAGVDGLALDEHPTDGVNRFLTGFLPDFMKQPYHGAIEVSPKQIRAVLRERLLRCLMDLQ